MNNLHILKEGPTLNTKVPNNTLVSIISLMVQKRFSNLRIFSFFSQYFCSKLRSLSTNLAFEKCKLLLTICQMPSTRLIKTMPSPRMHGNVKWREQDNVYSGQTKLEDAIGPFPLLQLATTKASNRSQSCTTTLNY